MLEPIRKSQWNKVTAAHLFNRAGFGATSAEIEAAAKRDPAEVVAELVDFERVEEQLNHPAWAVAEGAAVRRDKKMFKDMQAMTPEQRREKIKEQQKIDRERILELRAWWLKQLHATKRPLQEKLTVFWHGHWATSAEKVKQPYALWLQNQTLRKFAAGNFKKMAVALSQDPAMLYYLDNAMSKAEKPNENYARELMELFTLGIGNYTEEDIKASARAFTGWTVSRDRVEFADVKFNHDGGVKEFMGRTGKFTPYDIIDIIFDQPACATYVPKKLWSFFAFENPDEKLVAALGSAFKSGGWELKPLLKKIFLSEEFYSKTALRTQIKSPVQWLIGTTRSLEAPLPHQSVCQGILHMLGQDLLAPPSVKGWDGGYTWITTNSLLSRYNFAGILVKGGEMIGADTPRMADLKDKNKKPAQMGGPMGSVMRAMARSEPLFDCKKILPPEARKDKNTALARLEWELFRTELTSAENKELRASFAELPEPAKWDDAQIRTLVHTMMSTPHFQLT